MSSPLAKLVVGVALITSACSGDKSASASADSSLVRDLALASAPTAQPTFQDTAVAPAPVKASPPKREVPAPVKRPRARAPKPEPQPEKVEKVAEAPTPAPTVPVVAPQATVPAPAPAPLRGEIAAGSTGALTTAAKVCTSSNMVGDKLVATLNTTLTGSNGFDLPAGSTVVLEVASVSPGETADGARITFRVRSIVVNDKTYTVAADVAPLGNLDRTKIAGTDPNSGKKKVIGGAIAGAILGQLIGHDTKGTVIGAAAGAAAGAAVSKSGEKWEACLPSGAQLQLKLTEPLVLS